MKAKRIIAAVLLLILALTAAACGNTEEKYNADMAKLKADYQPVLNETITALRKDGFDKEVVINMQTFDGVTLDGGWDKKNGNWNKQNETVRCIAGEDNPLTQMLDACYNISENTEVVSIDKSIWFGEKTYKIELRHVEAKDESKPCQIGFGDDVKYDWANLKAMNNIYVTITTKKGKITKLEVFEEDVFVYWGPKSVADDTPELKADVYKKINYVVTF